jgi:hypothetical protein
MSWIKPLETATTLMLTRGTCEPLFAATLVTKPPMFDIKLVPLFTAVCTDDVSILN